MRIPCYTQGLVLAYKKRGDYNPAVPCAAGRRPYAGKAREDADVNMRSSKGYVGLLGFLRYIKRRPRRLDQRTRTCCYCGDVANEGPAVAMAINSSGRLVDMKRLSAPHCKNCGTMIA